MSIVQKLTNKTTDQFIDSIIQCITPFPAHRWQEFLHDSSLLAENDP